MDTDAFKVVERDMMSSYGVDTEALSFLPASFFKSASGFFASVLTTRSLLAFAIPQSLLHVTHPSQDNDDVERRRQAVLAAQQDVLARYCEVLSLELHLPQGMRMLPHSLNSRMQDVDLPQVRRPATDFAYVHFFRSRLRMVSDTILKKKKEHTNDWYLPCPFPPSFTEAEVRIALRVCREEGFEGGTLDASGGKLQGLRYVREVPEKRPREESLYAMTTDEQKKHVKQSSASSVSLRTVGDGRPATAIVETTRVASRDSIPRKQLFLDSSLAPWISCAFWNCWFWKSCSVFIPVPIDRRAQVAQTSAAMDRVKNGCRKGKIEDTQANSCVAHHYPCAPNSLLGLGQSQGTMHSFHKRAAQEFAELQAAQGGSFPVCRGAPMLFAAAQVPVLSVSPAQQLYSAVSSARGGAQASSLMFENRASVVSTSKATCVGTRSNAAPKWESGALVPGWSVAYCTAAACYVATDHVRRRAYLDVSPNSPVLRQMVAADDHRNLPPAMRACIDDASLVRSSQALAETLPPILRKASQFMTRNELINAVDRIRMGTPSTIPSVTPPDSWQGNSAKELYNEVQCNHGRKADVPSTFFRSDSSPATAAAHDGAVITPLHHPLPPGCTEDDQWVMNHVFGIATHHTVPVGMSLPHRTSATHHPWEARRAFRAVVVDADVRQWTWQRAIRARLDASTTLGVQWLDVDASDSELPRHEEAGAEQRRREGSIRHVCSDLQTFRTRFGSVMQGIHLSYVIRRHFMHQLLLDDAHTTFDVGLILGDSRDDASFYQRWRHMEGAEVQLHASGVFFSQSMCALVVSSYRAKPLGIDVASWEEVEEEFPLNVFLPIAFNGSIDSLEESFTEPVHRLLGQLLAEWVLLRGKQAAGAFWDQEVRRLLLQVEAHDMAFVPFNDAMTLVGRIRIS